MPNKLQLAAQQRQQQQEVPAPVITPMGIPDELIDYESIDEPSTIAGLHRGGGGLLTDNPIPLWKRLDATRRLISSYEHIIEFTTKLLDPMNAPTPPNGYVLTNEDRMRMAQRVAASYQRNITFYTNLLETARRRLVYLEALKTPDTFADIEEDEE
jgi:hypothetical protein